MLVIEYLQDSQLPKNFSVEKQIVRNHKTQNYKGLTQLSYARVHRVIDV